MVKKSRRRSWKSLVARPLRGLQRNIPCRLQAGSAAVRPSLLQHCSSECRLCSRARPVRLSFTSLFVSSWDWDCFVDFTCHLNVEIRALSSPRSCPPLSHPWCCWSAARPAGSCRAEHVTFSNTAQHIFSPINYSSDSHNGKLKAEKLLRSVGILNMKFWKNCI